MADIYLVPWGTVYVIIHIRRAGSNEQYIIVLPKTSKYAIHTQKELFNILLCILQRYFALFKLKYSPEK